MSDIFDFEQQIMDAWHVTEDIQVVLEGISEKNMSKDDIMNVLLGLKTLYTLKFEKLFDTFEKDIVPAYYKGTRDTQEYPSIRTTDSYSVNEPDNSEMGV